MKILVKIIFLVALAGMVASQGCKRYCYTKWMNRDRPSGSGDYESLNHVSKMDVCSQPVGIQCQTSRGRPYNSTGNNLALACEPRKGLVCVNSQQGPGKRCEDYRVRYLCPEGSIRNTRGIVCGVFCDTPFRDRDNPSGHCDCEGVNYGSPSCPGGAPPVGIRCNDVRTGKDYAQFGQNMTCKQDVGGFCWNKFNPCGCRDYKVQYICPKRTVPPGPTCNTATVPAEKVQDKLSEMADEENFIADMDDDYEEESEAEMAGEGLDDDGGKAVEELDNDGGKAVEDLLVNELLQSLGESLKEK